MCAPQVQLQLLALLASALVATSGEYDTLRRAAAVSLPGRVTALRDTLIDHSIYEEVVFNLLSYLAATDSQDAVCSNHSSLLQLGVLQDQLWAIQMLDASAKPAAGLLQGNFQLLGDYDECLAVDGPGGLFTGQMCVVSTRGLFPAIVPRPKTSEHALVPMLPTEPALAVCVPSSCSARAMQAHWQAVMEEFNASASVTALDCSTRDDNPLDTRAKITIGVLAALFLAVASSTFYDYWVNHQPTKERRILTCFSAHASLRKLLDQRQRADSLDVLDGLRVLAISWIVLGHRFEYNFAVPNYSLGNVELYLTAWYMAPLLNMPMAVELFFLLSGCLLSYHFLRAHAKAEPFNIVHFYYKRIVRLTPALALMMLLDAGLLIHVSDGPLWKRLIGFRMDNCVDNWWSTLLYVSNYANPYKMCLLQTWYLSADMQLYLVAPLLLLPLARCRSKGLLLLAGCYVATTVAAFCNAHSKELHAGATITLNKKTESNHGDEYVKTHVRAASWLTGLALGVMLHHYRQGNHKWEINLVTAAAAWSASLALCVYGVYSVAPFQALDYEYSRVADSLHIALHRNLFSVGAAGVVFLCVASRGGVVKEILGWSGFRPLATLSYGVYLTHMSLQMVTLARVRQAYVNNMFNLSVNFASDLVFANLAALILYVCVEAPFWEIGHWLYNPKRPRVANENPPPLGHVNLEDRRSVL